MRIAAVSVLVAGLVAGLVVGLQKSEPDTLAIKPDEARTQAEAAMPAPDTDNPQPRPAGALLQEARQEGQITQEAQAQAAERAREASNDAQARADAAAKAAKQREEEAKKKQNSGGSGGEKPPPAPADCSGYSGNRLTGCSLLSWAGFGLDQMSCLDKLWTKESQWRTTAENPSSGAYGVPQALPRTKMAAYGDDYLTNPVPQIKWGLNYIKGRYGNPCAAWSHSQAKGWY